MNHTLKPYQIEFIDFLLNVGALKFGSFTLKSGRKAPYFVNFGDFNSADKLTQLGYFYAQAIINNDLSELDTIFGPTYKGVPLCITTAMNLSKLKQRDYGFTFNRKEAKQHGESGILVGTQINAATKLVIVEDVITAGTTMREIVPLVNSFGASIKAVVIAVDRCEKGQGSQSALTEVSNEFNINILPIVTIRQIHAYLQANNKLTQQQLADVASYLEEYGA